MLCTYNEFLFSYGSNYYSYIYVKMLRQATWKKLFDPLALSREGGERFRRTILEPGCSRDYHSVVVDLLGAFPSTLAANV